MVKLSALPIVGADTRNSRREFAQPAALRQQQVTIMPTNYLGWFRSSRKTGWRQVVTAPTSDACWQALLAALADSPSGDCRVTAATERPIGRVEGPNMWDGITQKTKRRPTPNTRSIGRRSTLMRVHLTREVSHEGSQWQ